MMSFDKLDVYIVLLQSTVTCAGRHDLWLCTKFFHLGGIIGLDNFCRQKSAYVVKSRGILQLCIVKTLDSWVTLNIMYSRVYRYSRKWYLISDHLIIWINYVLILTRSVVSTGVLGLNLLLATEKLEYPLQLFVLTPSDIYVKEKNASQAVMDCPARYSQ